MRRPTGLRVLLVVSSSRVTGPERHVVDLAAGLHRAGITAEVVCPGGGEGLETELGRNGIRVHTLPLETEDMCRAVPPLARLAAGFDLMHAHLARATAAGVAAKLLGGRPVIETAHVVPAASATSGLLRRATEEAVHRWVRRGVDLTLVFSSVAGTVVRGSSAVIHPGVPSSPPRTRRSVTGRFVSLGPLYPNGVVELLLTAFARAASSLPQTAHLTVVAEDQARPRIERQVLDLGISSRVSFAGSDHCPRLAVRDYDIYLATAGDVADPAALGAAEAGLPVIAVRPGGLVEHGVTGLVVAPDAKALSDAMVKVASDARLCDRLGANGRERAHRYHSVDRMIGAIVRQYRAVTSRQAETKVLRLYHSAVVGEWRERDRQLRRRGADMTLISPRCFDEGGKVVKLDVGDDSFVVPVRTVGRHPMLFCYDLVPLGRLLRRFRYDVIDLHEEPGSLAAAEILILCGLFAPSARLLVYSAQNIDKRYPLPFRFFERLILERATAIYVCNEAAAGIVKRKGARGLVRTLPLGVDLALFEPRRGDESSSGARAGQLRLGYVGRLEPWKGVHVLIEALGDEPGWFVVIAGDGPQRGELSSLVDALGIASRVEFAGFQSHEGLPALYRSFDALVVPSIPSRDRLEQFCRVAVEAMACAVPVIASAVGALPEVVGEAGLLVPPGDPGALRGALRTLADDPELRRLLGQQSLQQSRRYGWASVAEAHYELYNVGRP